MPYIEHPESGRLIPIAIAMLAFFHWLFQEKKEK